MKEKDRKQDTAVSLDRVVLHAAALSTVDRGSYLRDLATSHPQLMAEARRLLDAANAVSESFLEVPAGGIHEDQKRGREDRDHGTQNQSARARRLDPDQRYDLRERVGVGGMAEVFRAWDRQLDRPVALKLLRFDDPERENRCLMEARAQARVVHGNVLEVYDTGSFGGRPFISMRCVEGSSLMELRETTSLEQQVRILVQVAKGLDAAHGIGLVHRDVKPSNVLVEATHDGDLKAWVTDFGIAAVPQPAASGEKGLRGTAQFLAPERLTRPQDAVDRRSDIFSLGVTMYQLFTGELPFDDEMLFEVLRQIRDETPPTPRQLVPTLPVELEAIVLKCMAKDPEARYRSARAVAEDLARFLSGETVEAYAASLAYRFTRFAIRHKTLLTVLGIAAVLLFLALSIATALGVQARRANAEAARRKAQAEDLIGFMLVDLREKLEKVGRLDILDDVGAKATTYFASVPRQELTDEELARHATALYQIGEVRLKQGNLAQAQAPFAQSLALARELVARYPDDGDRIFELGQSHFWVGFVRWREGDLEGATEHFRAYLDVSERLVEIGPERSEWHLELAYAHSNLGTVLRDRGDIPGARQRYGHSLEIRERLVARHPGQSSYRLEVALAHNALGVLLETLGEPAAGEHFASELAIKQELAQADPGNVQLQDHLAVAHNYLGHRLLSHGQWRDAREHFASAVTLYETLVGHDETNADWQFKLTLNLGALGRAIFGLEGAAPALGSFQRQGVMLERLAGLDPERRDWRQTLAACHYFRAKSLEKLGEMGAAREQGALALALLDALSRNLPGSRDVQRRRAEIHLLFGDLADRDGDELAAKAAWQRAVEELAHIDTEASDPSFLAPRIAALLRLDEGGTVAADLALLRARGFCDPMFPELCPPARASSPAPRS